MSERLDTRTMWAGTGLVIGAGMGVTIGLLVAGGIGVALGAAFGAGLGLVLGSLIDAWRLRTDRSEGH